MTKATPIRIQQIEDQMRRRQFEAQAQAFLMRWQPQGDPAMTAQFNAELYGLLRQLFMDASSEMTELVGNVLSLMNPHPKIGL